MTEEPDMLQSMGLKRVGHDLEIEQQESQSSKFSSQGLTGG